jgi:PiT family inorganic phosphate transporter
LNASSGTSGVDWSQAMGVFRALLFSPVVGFVFSALMLLVMKALVRQKTLYAPPDTAHPPPPWIRGLLVLTCTGVSFAHGSNDGQKGMGLIMLILIGAAPTAYALNHALPDSSTPAFEQAMQSGHDTFMAHAGDAALPAEDARARVTEAIRTRSFNQPAVFVGTADLAADISRQVREYGAVSRVPGAAVENVRNEMYLASEAVRLMKKDGTLSAAGFTADEQKSLDRFTGALNASTRFIPTWVKVAVAIALGLGTMVGWKRIVVTVGEKIGKSHLTYGQGASAELIAAATIMAADIYGLPVSTTHVLSSGVAGTMLANGSGLQWSTLRSIGLAWVLTLPMAMLLSGVLFAMFRAVM